MRPLIFIVYAFWATALLLAEPQQKPHTLQALNLSLEKEAEQVPKELVQSSIDLVTILDSNEPWRICFLEMPELPKEQALKNYWQANYPNLPQPDISSMVPLKPRLRKRPEDGVPRRLLRAFIVRDDVWVFEYAFDDTQESMTNGAVFVSRNGFWKLVNYNIYLGEAIERASRL